MANTKIINDLCAEAEGIATAYKEEMKRVGADLADAQKKLREAEDRATKAAGAGNYDEHQQAEKDRSFWTARVFYFQRKSEPHNVAMFPDKNACFDLASRVEKAARKERAEWTRELLVHLEKAEEIAETCRKRESEVSARFRSSVTDNARREHGRIGFDPIVTPYCARELVAIIRKIRASINEG